MQRLGAAFAFTTLAVTAVAVTMALAQNSDPRTNCKNGQIYDDKAARCVHVPMRSGPMRTGSMHSDSSGG